jgi:hypothetical protein
MRARAKFRLLCRQCAAEIRGDYLAIWRHTALKRLRVWNFNTIGNWSEPRLLEGHEMPYAVPIHTYGDFTRVSNGSDWWGKMPDPFHPAFATACRKKRRQPTETTPIS